MRTFLLTVALASGLCACSASRAPNGLAPGGGSSDTPPDAPGADDGAACTAATGLAASSVSATAITLSWPGGPGVSATIERKSYCGSDAYAAIGSAGAGSASFTDSTVQAQWVYWYRLTTTDAQGGTAVLAVAASAAATNAPSCAGGATPQDSGAAATCTGSGSDAGTGPGPGPGSSTDHATLDCAASTQPEICNYLNTSVTFKSPAATRSTACDTPTNVVAADSTNFAAVMGSVTAGHTVVFAAGTYEVASTLSLQSNVNYCGQSDPTKVVLHKASGALLGGGDISNVTIAGLTLDGAGIQPASYTNVFIQNNVFQNDQQDWPYGQGVLAGSSTNLTIAGNTFTNNGTGIQTYTEHGLTITDNHFVTVHEGMHLLFQQSSATARVARNVFVESNRIMIEMQNNDGTANTDLVVEDNVILFPKQAGFPDTYGMGISAAIPASQGAIVRNNWLFGPVGNYQTLGVLALELMGTNLVTTGNTVQYWNSGTSFSYNGPTQSLTGNSFCNVMNVLTQDGGFNGFPATQSNNGCAMNAAGFAVPQ